MEKFTREEFSRGASPINLTNYGNILENLPLNSPSVAQHSPHSTSKPSRFTKDPNKNQENLLKLQFIGNIEEDSKQKGGEGMDVEAGDIPRLESIESENHISQPSEKNYGECRYI